MKSWPSPTWRTQPLQRRLLTTCNSMPTLMPGPKTRVGDGSRPFRSTLTFAPPLLASFPTVFFFEATIKRNSNYLGTVTRRKRWQQRPSKENLSRVQHHPSTTLPVTLTHLSSSAAHPSRAGRRPCRQFKSLHKPVAFGTTIPRVLPRIYFPSQ